MESPNLENTIQKNIARAFEKVGEYETPDYLSRITLDLTGREEVAEKVKNIVKIAVSWVVFMDLYYESGIKDYESVSNKQRSDLYSNLDSSQEKILERMEVSIVDPFWKYEEELRSGIKSGKSFNQQEIEDSLFRRSEDSVLYGTLTSFYCDFPQEAIQVLHVRQLFEDILDCVEDYEEDLEGNEPNIFFMYLLNRNIPKEKWPKTFIEARDIFYDTGVFSDILNFVGRLHAESKEILLKIGIPLLEKELDEQFRLVQKELGRKK